MGTVLSHACMADDPKERRSVWLDRDTWVDRRGRKWVRNPLYRRERMTIYGGTVLVRVVGAALTKLRSRRPR